MILLGAFDSGQLVAFSLLIDDGSVVHVYWFGCIPDHRLSRELYFELAYYSPIELACAQDWPKLSFGYATEETRPRRAMSQFVVRGCLMTDDAGITEEASHAAEWLSTTPLFGSVYASGAERPHAAGGVG